MKNQISLGYPLASSMFDECFPAGNEMKEAFVQRNTRSMCGPGLAHGPMLTFTGHQRPKLFQAFEGRLPEVCICDVFLNKAVCFVHSFLIIKIYLYFFWGCIVAV